MERRKASDFPQELIGLLNGYVHGGISRRQFLSRAEKYTVGGVTAAALFQMLRPNYAWAIQVPPSRCQRKKVEMLFAHLKRILKLDQLRLRGPNGARHEFHLAATAQNLRKLAKLIPIPSPIAAT